MRLGEKKTFRRAAFLEEGGPAQGATGKIMIPRTVTGVVTWGHPEGRYYVVTYEPNGHQLRECFPQGK